MTGLPEAGTLKLFLGSASAQLANNISESILGDHSQLGSSVSTAGDVDGDGFSDVVVGAPNYDTGTARSGAAFLIHGTAKGMEDSSTRMHRLTGCLQDNALFGHAIARAGDVNGDGFDDVIVGAPGCEDSRGHAFVYLGSPDSGIDDQPYWQAEGESTGAKFGFSVNSAGDVNGDGFSDLLIGAPYDKSSGVTAGKAYVFHGGPQPLSTNPAWASTSDRPGAEFGYSVSAAGDTNADGYSDIVIGAPGYQNDVLGNDGRAFVYLGAVGGVSDNFDWMAKEVQQAPNVGSRSRFGTAVANAGDVNGDGFSDLLVGSPGNDISDVDAGAALLYLGGLNGLADSA